MKTEKEKMLAGEIYDANNDTELLKDRTVCKELCHQYNLLSPYQKEKKEGIIRQLFGQTGKQFIIEPTLYCDYGYNIEIGENFYSNHNLVILDAAKVSFGDNVFIAPNCSFYTAGHPLDVELRNQGLEYAYPITIGSNVWIGGGVIVLPGVSIGSGSTIGAGSVVTKDIPENSLALGNPCRVIRKLKE
ncbi:MAG: sugar O-acetyltransferase [Bacteroidales bacterium]